jgi:hypothetical protein
MTAPHTSLIERDGAVVRLQGTPAFLTELQAQVAPYLVLRDDDDARAGDAWLVVAGLDDARARDATFVLDRTPFRAEPDRRLWISTTQRTIAVEHPPGPWLVTMVRRVLHNLLRTQLAARGAVFLHGALCTFRGRGVAFVGGKRAGKTSSLLALLALPETCYCTNDDLSIHFDGGGPMGIGWPRTINIRRDTHGVLRDQLGIELASVRTAHPLSEPQIPLGEDARQAKHAFRPDELAGVLGRPLIPEARLSLIVIPAFAPEVEVAPIAVADRLASLGDALELAPDPKHAGFAQRLLPPVDDALRARNLDRLIHEVPWVRLCQPLEALVAGRDRIAAIANASPGQWS